MSSRRRFTTAAVAAGLALVPGAAFAGTASQPASRAPSIASVDALAKSGSGIPLKTFDSPASKSVHSQKPDAVKNATAASDPDLAVALRATDQTARSVQLAVTVAADSGFSGTVAVDWGDGASSDLSFVAGVVQDVSHTYPTPGAFTIGATATDNAANTAQNSADVVTEGNDFTPFGPVRLLDTRYGTGAPVGQIPRGGMVRLQVGGFGSQDGQGGIPQNVTAVVMNITVTDAHGAGFVTATDDGDPDPPAASNVNFTAGQTVPNLAIVPVGADGEVDLINSGSLAGGIDLIADVTGYFTASAAAGYTSLAPDRLVDTRYGTGAPKSPLAPNGTIAVRIAGQDGGDLPSGPIAAVALNVTVTDTRGDGFLTVYPDGTPLPDASNVNYSDGQTVANSVIVPVGSNGEVDITDSGAQTEGTDVVVDVTGYFSADGASAYVPVEPHRAVDTRSSDWKDGPLKNGDDSYFPLPIGDDVSGDPLPGVTGLVLNATVTDTEGNGFLTFAPDPNTYQEYTDGKAALVSPPNSSSLNWVKGETVPNLVQADTGKNGIVDVWNLGVPAGNADLIIDIFGLYQDN